MGQDFRITPYTYYACMFPLYSFSYQVVWNCCLHNECMNLHGNFTNYGFSVGLIFTESSPARAKHARPTVEFAGDKPQRPGS